MSTTTTAVDFHLSCAFTGRKIGVAPTQEIAIAFADAFILKTPGTRIAVSRVWDPTDADFGGVLVGVRFAPFKGAKVQDMKWVGDF